MEIQDWKKREYIACLEIGGHSIKLGVSLFGVRVDGVREHKGDAIVAVPTGHCTHEGAIQNVLQLQQRLKELFEMVKQELGFQIEEVYVDCIGRKILSEKIRPSVECNDRFSNTQTNIIVSKDIELLKQKVRDVQRKDVNELFDHEALAYYKINAKGEEVCVGSSVDVVVGNVAHRCACLYNLYYNASNDGDLLTKLLREVGVKRHRMRVALRGAVQHMLAREEDRSSLMLIVNVGYDFTEFGYVKDQKLYKYYRQVGLGGKSITMRISEKLGVSFDEAEKLKRSVEDLDYDQMKDLTPDELVRISKSIDRRDRTKRVKMEIVFALLLNFCQAIIDVLKQWNREHIEEMKVLQPGCVESNFYNNTVGFIVHKILLTGGGLQFKDAIRVLEYGFINKRVTAKVQDPAGGAEQEVSTYPYTPIRVAEGLLGIDYRPINENSSALLFNQSQCVSIIGLRELAMEDGAYAELSSPTESVSNQTESEQQADVEQESEQHMVQPASDSGIGPVFGKLKSKFEGFFRVVQPSSEEEDEC